MKAILALGALVTVRGDPEVICNTNTATCVNDNIKNIQNLQSAGNFCDAGTRDVCHLDKDITNDVVKNVNAAKYTNIERNNAKVGPNIVRKNNDVLKDCSVCANIIRTLDETKAVKVPYPYRSYNNVNEANCWGPVSNGCYGGNNCYGGYNGYGGCGGGYCTSPYYGGYGGCGGYGGYGGCYDGGCSPYYGGYGGCGGGYYGGCGGGYGGYNSCGYNNYGNKYYNGGNQNRFCCQSGTY